MALVLIVAKQISQKHRLPDISREVSRCSEKRQVKFKCVKANVQDVRQEAASGAVSRHDSRELTA